MATEALKMMKEQLMSCVQGQLGDISKVDAHELGEAVDMIKDLAEAIYYCTLIIILHRIIIKCILIIGIWSGQAVICTILPAVMVEV